MLDESKDLIVKNFFTLMRECDVEVLKKLMVDKQVFTQKELDDIFSTNDKRHNKRVFFFNIQKKEQRAFNILIDCLRQTKQHFIADLLQPQRTTKVFQEMCIHEETDNHEEITNLPLTPTTPRPLTVKVQPSVKFTDSFRHNHHIECYSTRSKKRGRLLIINNFNFSEGEGYRNGADVDTANLLTLFKQMGGWDIVLEMNKTAVEMEVIIKDFAVERTNKEYDICFVIIMSHGSEKNNETLILGIDNKCITSTFVVKQFSNEYCRSWRDKPKVIMFQVCRGPDLDHSIRHVMTETDSMRGKEPEILPIKSPSPPAVLNIRSEEDVLVCYTTLLGYKSHRNTVLGSWYIEILCEKIMNFAHNTPLDEILMLVDQGLKRRMSDWASIQTSEHIYRGFNKKLFLHPGIYYEDDTVKQFFS